jgi:hypothetical protein
VAAWNDCVDFDPLHGGFNFVVDIRETASCAVLHCFRMNTCATRKEHLKDVVTDENPFPFPQRWANL